MVILASQIAGHLTAVSIPHLAKGTAMLRTCKLKSITCQVYTVFASFQDALQSDHIS